MAYAAQVTDPEQRLELEHFISTCRSDMVLFDIGAHFGIFSFAALHFGGLNAYAVAVDPSPSAVRMMEIQARENGFLDRIRMVEAAVGSHTGELAMVATGVVGGKYFVLPQDHPKRDLTLVRETTIDELRRTVGVVPTHIKIDVEGAEASVLEGAKGVLTDASPMLFLELHHKIVRQQGGNPEATLDLLDALGYQPFTTAGRPVARHTLLAQDLVRCFAKRA